MAGEPTAAGRVPGARAALGFSLAAVAACWNPFAAPIGLAIGIAAAWLSWRALRRAGARRRLPAVALSLSAVAVIASAVVVALTAGSIGGDLPGQPVVKAPTAQELDARLAAAAERTRAERERARAELEKLPGSPDRGSRPRPSAGSPPRPDGGPPPRSDAGPPPARPDAG